MQESTRMYKKVQEDKEGSRRFKKVQEGKKGTEEERRLAYVGITRAKRHCTISFASNRRVYNQWQASIPSRFVDELPFDHVEILNPPGLYGRNESNNFDSENLDIKMGEGRYNSPGWTRLTANTVETYKPLAKQRSGFSEPKESSIFSEEDRVFHQKFGYGKILEIDGDKVTIDFEKAGEKKLMLTFIEKI